MDVAELKRVADLVGERRGWSFDRMRAASDPEPWEYEDVVRRYLQPSSQVLDTAPDDVVILPVLECDRRWAAYALCDLEPPYLVHARFIGAADGEQAGAVLMSTAASYVPVRQGPGYPPETRSQRMDNRAAGTGCRCIQGAHRREWQRGWLATPGTVPPCAPPTS
jgi:hypothetical protein